MEDLVINGVKVAVTKNTKNPELRQAFGEELKTGLPFIYATAPGKPGWIAVYLAQEVKNPNLADEEGFDSDSMGAGTRILRAEQTFAEDMFEPFAEKHGYDMRQVGLCLKGTRIKLTQTTSTDNLYPGQEPKIYGQNSPNAGKVMLSGGLPIYEFTKWVKGHVQDSLLIADPVVALDVEQ